MGNIYFPNLDTCVNPLTTDDTLLALFDLAACYPLAQSPAKKMGQGEVGGHGHDCLLHG